MKILIIGSKGFIGSHAFQYFNSNINYECRGCDVVVDYNEPNYSVIDSTNADFNEIFENENFDYCINCSGAASVPDSFKNPLRDFTLNTYNVIKILEAIRKHRPACKFINLSSAAVYGNPDVLPVTEDSLKAPLSPYGLHKLQAEQLCESFYKNWNIGTCILRIFSAFGIGLKKQLLWDIAQKSLSSNHISLFGTGMESRDFIYVTDIVRAIECIIEKGEFNAAVYNIASGKEIYIKDAVSILLASMNWQGQLEFSGNGRSGDPINWRADINRLQSLGYKAEIPFSNGVELYSKWLRESR